MTPKKTKGFGNSLPSLDESLTKSSFPGVIYSGPRGIPFPNIFDWLGVKRQDDNVGKYWRVHNKLYDLEDFIEKHPGGRDWIQFTKGTDITESFEASHIVGYQRVEKILEKYYIKDIESPRNSPYTFKNDGFYKTLKRKVEPVLKEVGTASSGNALLIADGLAVTYCALALVSVWTGSIILQILAGLVLGMCVVGAHNFFHKKDNFRQYYMDLSPLSSFEWRISHAFSHHMYPNTVLDFEIMLGEPLVQMLPRPKNFMQKYAAVFYAEPLYFLYGLTQIIVRIVSIANGKQNVRPENCIIFVELLIFLFIAPSYQSGLSAWIIIFMMASFWFIFVSNNSSHHDPMNFHDGDEPRKFPDFGLTLKNETSPKNNFTHFTRLCQLDATRGKSDIYHKPLFSVLTTFGEHPLHHLFPTVCHSKLKFLKPALEETLHEFSEEFPELTQLQLFIGTHLQITRTETHSHHAKGKSK